LASPRPDRRSAIELAVTSNGGIRDAEYERLGLDDQFFELLGVKVPLIRMPVAPGRNIAILVEVAARNQLLRARGHHAARILADRLSDASTAPSRPVVDR
jgi:HPr kinase/phosphorylase